MAVKDQQRLISRFISTGGDMTGLVPPAVDDLRLLTEAVLLERGFDPADARRPHAKIFKTLNLHKPLPGLYEEFLDEDSGKALANHDFKSVATHQIGNITLRIINAEAEGSAFSGLKEAIGGSQQRLVVATERIDMAVNQRNLGLVYGEESTAVSWMGDAHTVAVATVARVDSIRRLEDDLHAMGDDQTNGFDTGWVVKLGGQPDPERTEGVVSYDVLKQATSESLNLSPNIEFFVSEYLGLANDAYQAAISDGAEALSKIKGSQPGAERLWLQSRPHNQLLEAQAASHFMKLVHPEVYPQDHRPMPLVALCTNETIDFVSTTFLSPDDRPTELGFDPASGARLLQFKNRFVITAPSPLESHQYLGAYSFDTPTT